MKPERIKFLQKLLTQAEEEFLKTGEIESDAIAPALRYKEKSDREFAALVCAVLAYGKVQHIKMSVNRLLAPLGSRPTEFLKTSNKKEIAESIYGWKHRFNKTEDAINLLLLLKSVYENEGSIENFAVQNKNFSSAKDLLENFVFQIEDRLKTLKIKPSRTFWFFFSKPSSGSACKRLNLYLRWMVGSGPFDLNLWTSIHESQLMIPLDVHLLNQARSLKMTKRKQADWRTVEEVTEKLRLLDKNNPTRFDFALCHLGINGKILASLALLIFMGCQKTPVMSEEIKVSTPIVVKKVQFTYQDESRFLRAIKDDDVNQVHFFITMGMDVNKNFKTDSQFDTPLMLAIESKSRNSIRLLLDSGARADALMDDSRSELVSAILTRQELVALELLDKGSRFDKVLKDSGETALMSAARVGFCSVVKQLLERGAKPNLVNDDGYSALMYAAEFGHSECVEHLLFGGADKKLRNEAHKTAKDIASAKLNPETRKKL